VKFVSSNLRHIIKITPRVPWARERLAQILFSLLHDLRVFTQKIWLRWAPRCKSIVKDSLIKLKNMGRFSPDAQQRNDVESHAVCESATFNMGGVRAILSRLARRGGSE